MSPRAAVLYLGTRGGGAEISKMLCASMQNWSGIDFAVAGVSSTNAQIDALRSSGIQTVEITSGFNLKSFKRVASLAFHPGRLLSLLGIAPGSFVLMPMASPLDLPLAWRLRRSGVILVRFIHDPAPHLGDSWPGKRTIKYLETSSDLLVVMSRYVLEQFPKKMRLKTLVLPHPTFDFANDGELPSELKGQKYILFVGRIRSYKGLDQLFEAWGSLAPTISPFKLVVAGEGELRVKNPPQTIVLNRWLGESEIAALVKNATAVVFPYLEASQSGLLPFVVSLGKKVIVTPVGGLLEQTSDYLNAFVSKSSSSSDLATAIKESLNSEQSEVFEPKDVEDWSEPLRVWLLSMSGIKE